MPTISKILCAAFAFACSNYCLGQSDPYQRVIVSTENNDVSEVYFKPGSGEPIGLAPLQHIEGNVLSIAGYFTPTDSYKHVIVAQDDGTISELSYKPHSGVEMRHLRKIPDAVAVSAYYAPTDDLQHIIVGTHSGEVWEIFFKQGKDQVGMRLLKHIDGEVCGVSGYYAKNDNRQHVIVSTKTGDVCAIHFKPGSKENISTSLLKHFDIEIAGVSGYYAEGDNHQHVIVALKDGTVNEISFKQGNEIDMRVLKKLKHGIVSISGYYAPSDEYHHVMVGTRANDIWEILFKAGSDRPTTMGILKHLNGNIRSVSGHDGMFADIDKDRCDDAIEQQLLSRFRPYYKFSYDHGTNEPYSPVDAIAYIKGSRLRSSPEGDAEVICDWGAFSQNPGALLMVNWPKHGWGLPDLSKNQSDCCHYHLDGDPKAYKVSKWTEVISNGHVGLYGHVVPVGKHYKIEYWQFFSYNSAGHAQNYNDHAGDWECITLIVDESFKALTISHFANGREIKFDINNIRPVHEGNIAEYRGRNYYAGSEGHDLSNGDQLAKCQNNLVRFFRENKGSGYTHPVVYVEYGTHSFWPSEHWTYSDAPKHKGDSYQFLTSVPPNLGEVENPMSDDAAIIMRFNGRWGAYTAPGIDGKTTVTNPEGPALHWQWQWPANSEIRGRVSASRK